MKVINDFLKQLGVRQYGGRSLDKGFDPYDERFTCLASFGIHEEGRPDMVWAATEEDALVHYMEQLQKWLAGRTVILWRVYPRLESNPESVLGRAPRPRWNVYSRLTAYTPEEFSEILP